ncbi:MAG: NAD-dependent epimerase/dehydratase family protein [Aureibaculum sp.]
MGNMILIIGACGQIGTELTLRLRKVYGKDNVIASDIREGTNELMESGKFEFVDATDKEAILKLVKKYKITDVYLMAAMLSAMGEKHPQKAWNLNMNSLLTILEIAKHGFIKKIFWPSSIAIFGNSTPKQNTPQTTVMEPTTVYGISKLAGENWCSYYKNKFQVDVRGVRYPGIISWKTDPGGGTTDYAVEIYHEAIKNNYYDCFIAENTRLPMMYMNDAIDATIDLMKADVPDEYLSYNISAIDFTPAEIALSIKKHLPDFKISYSPDFRQEIAKSWPESIDDAKAKEDWNWEHSYDLERMTKEMLKNLMDNYKS